MQAMRKGNVTKSQFSALFLEECFRRFDTIPWDSADFTAQDRKEILELWCVACACLQAAPPPRSILQPPQQQPTQCAAASFE